MNSIRKFLSIVVFFILITSCSSSFQSSKVQYKDYRINTKQPSNKQLESMLQPYADSVNKTMNDVLAEAAMPLEKKQPEGTLGNVLADAMLDQAQKNYQQTIDAVFINAGGIRLPSIPAGNITRGKIFEMAPFDNLIVVLQLKGSVLQSFLDLIAARGGWPCAGIQFSIKNKLATQVMINNKPIVQDKTYTIATLDYVANGGDDCTMLKNVPQLNNGFLFRDAVIQYCKEQKQQGKKLQSSIQNRVTNVQ